MDELEFIEKLMQLGRKYQMNHVSVGDVDLSFKPVAPAVPMDSMVPKPDLTAGMPGDDQMLFYSTPAFDDLAQEREDT